MIYIVLGLYGILKGERIMIKENQKVFNKILVLLDLLSFVLAFFIAWYIRMRSGIIPLEQGYLSFEQYLIPIVLMSPLYLIIYNYVGLYDPFRLKSIYDEIYNAIKANVYGLIVFTVLLFLTKEIHYSRVLLLIFGIISTSLACLERAIIRTSLRNLRRKGYNQKHMVFVGCSYLADEFMERLKDNNHWGYKVIGALDDNIPLNTVTKEGVTIIGTIKDLEGLLEQHNLDEVFITLDLGEYYKLKPIIKTCEKFGVRTQIIPGYYKYIPARPYVEELDGLPVINIRYVPLDNILNKTIKRTFDIIVSLMALILVSPILLITAIIIKITSPGPVIFKQERVGLNRKNFTMYKFRSMKLQVDEEEKTEWTTKEDPRKTKFGTFIRKTSIDELPQFFNVLKGDMSIIGPRPERPYFVEKFKEEIPKYMVKHQVRPGITGWAQVNGWRGDTSIEKRIEYDIYYIENWNFLFDIKIMILTVIKGFINKNAY